MTLYVVLVPHICLNPFLIRAFVQWNKMKNNKRFEIGLNPFLIRAFVQWKNQNTKTGLTTVLIPS